MSVVFEERPYYAIELYELLSGKNINAIFVDPLPSSTGYSAVVKNERLSSLEQITEYIFNVRKEYPEVVFVFYIDFDELEDQQEKFYAGRRSNFTHYYKLNRKLVGQEFDAALDNILRACRDYVVDYKRKTLYEYDVVLSFAGEDRKYANGLAETLRSQGLNVFYDSYERTTLWGKNLYTYLSEIYQHRAHYCVMFL